MQRDNACSKSIKQDVSCDMLATVVVVREEIYKW